MPTDPQIQSLLEQLEKELNPFNPLKTKASANVESITSLIQTLGDMCKKNELNISECSLGSKYPMPILSKFILSYPFIHGDISLTDELAIVRALLEAGIKDHQKIFHDVAAVVNMACYASVESMGLLISHGADVNLGDGRAFPPLMAAVSEGRLEMAQVLIASGADIHATDPNGFGALHAAVLANSKDLVLWLVKQGAVVDLQSHDHETPLTLAINKRPEMVFFLQEVISMKAERRELELSTAQVIKSGGEVQEQIIPSELKGIKARSL